MYQIAIMAFGLALVVLGFMDFCDFFFADKKPKPASMVRACVFLAFGFGICALQVVKGLS